MKQLTEILKRIPEFESLLAAIDGGACPAAVNGLSPVHRAHFAAGVRRETGRSAVVVCADEAEAAKTAEMLGALLSMAVKPGNSSIFVGNKEFEIMKKPGRGTHGHIAVKCNNVDRAIFHLGQRGVKFDLDSKVVKNGKTTAVYMADEIAGFAIHLVQK